ncbi:hypothetical protein SAMN05216231_2619 [Virgibacillus salinus]|uniref:DUF3953 domain-containing protein n=1 Tax=Virgibacillus salinus TaxID=553311 RepID=A0A1H1DXA5_9BACI|nr:hypothetical protein SAMN05216231_2619 [Virgibacillus salinus]
MRILGIVNFTLAICYLCVSLYHFFINSIDLYTNYLFPFLAFIFFLFGIEDVLKKETKPFNLYLLLSLVLFIGLGVELLKS